MRIIIISLIFFLAFGLTPGHAQPSLDEARSALNKGHYQQALESFNKMLELREDAVVLQERARLFYMTNELNKAIGDLTRSKQLGNEDPELYFQMARIHHHAQRYQEAAYFYKEFIKLSSTGAQAQFARYALKNCSFAAANLAMQQALLVQSFGPEVNRPHDEQYLIQDPAAGNKYYYSGPTATGQAEQVNALSLQRDGTWSRTKVPAVTGMLRDISEDGRFCLLEFSVNGVPGFEIRRCGHEATLKILDRDVFDGAVDVYFQDSTTILFTAKRQGGFGGLDIYRTLYSGGRWTTAENLGSGVNSSFNERTPFGRYGDGTLFFSSDRPYGYGGYDVYVRQAGGSAEHLNSTINSPGDELGFRLQGDGQMAYLTSSRKSGEGGLDMYYAYLDRAYPGAVRDSVTPAYLADIVMPAEQETGPHTVTEKSGDDVPGPAGSGHEDVDAKRHPSFIYYTDSRDILNDKNRRKLDSIITRIQSFDNATVHVLAYTDEDEPGLPEYKQYNTLNRAIKIAEYIVSQGVDPDRLILESYADNFPMVRRHPAGGHSDSLWFHNRKIELVITDGTKELEGREPAPYVTVPRISYDRRYELFKGIREELYYSVFIGRSERMFKNAVLRLFDDIYIRKETADANNDYYIGLFTQLEDAQKLKSQLDEMRGVTPRIKAFYMGKPVDTEMYDRLLPDYPELELFREEDFKGKQ